jgi:Ras-related protein Rab-28
MQYNEDIESKQFKMIILGDGAVGKTSICKRFADNEFSQQYKQTIGVDFFAKKMSLPPKTEATVQLWDIGGQSIGSKMLGNYITGAHVVLLAYDVTNAESFMNLEDWLRVVITTFKDKELPLLALIANKNDLRHMTAVRVEQHNAFAQENGMISFLMSAKSGDQVHSALLKLTSNLCGVPLSQKELEARVSTMVVPATIVDHVQHDPNVSGGHMPQAKAKSTGMSCVVS